MASNSENGVWRTVGGRRIFIKDGQSLADAMISSGKFKNDARSAYRKAKEEEEKKYEKVGKKIDNLTKEIEESKTEEEKKDTFTQTSTNPFYPDREYNKEQLNKMEENKIKPMENSYSGSGWEGTNYDSNLSTKDIAKNINDYSKKEFPDVKLSRKTDYNSIDMNIMSSGKNMIINEKDIDNFTGSQAIEVVKSSVGGIGRMDDYFIK